MPPDNYQEEPKGEVARRTSPTNIGLSLTANLAAHDFGFISLRRMFDRIELTLSSIDRMEKHRGHLLNWYRTDNLGPLEPRYVSTVDSGNFLGCLVALRNGLAEKCDSPIAGLEWRRRLARHAQASGSRLAARRIFGADSFRKTAGWAGQAAALFDERPTSLLGWDDWLERLRVIADKLDASVIPPPLSVRRWVTRLCRRSARPPRRN